MNLVEQALSFGSQLNINPRIKRRILFANAIFMVLPLVYFIFMLLDFEAYLQNPLNLHIDQWIVPLIISYCLVALYLNRQGYIYVSRITFLIIWPLAMHILPIILLDTPSDYYLAYPFGIILHAVLIQLIISMRSEPKIFWTLITFNVIMLLTSKNFLLANDLRVDMIEQEGVVNSGYYMLIEILYWLIFNFILFIILKVLDRLIDKTMQQQQVLEANNRQLLTMVENMEETNAKLTDQLDKHKTEVNDVVKSYSEYNAHSIRGPYCRIKGIIMLRQIAAIEEVDFEIKMKKSMEELEQAINLMQVQLNDKIDQFSKIQGSDQP